MILLCQGIQQEEGETTGGLQHIGGPRVHCTLGARRGPSWALAEYFVVLSPDSHSWAFDGSMSI